jgi:hypothetical protein
MSTEISNKNDNQEPKIEDNFQEKINYNLENTSFINIKEKLNR